MGRAGSTLNSLLSWGLEHPLFARMLAWQSQLNAGMKVPVLSSVLLGGSQPNICKYQAGKLLCEALRGQHRGAARAWPAHLKMKASNKTSGLTKSIIVLYLPPYFSAITSLGNRNIIPMLRKWRFEVLHIQPKGEIVGGS